ncbi:MAG TPA: dihydrolipoamide acetyltransferase family protein [Oligoflexus sp.]|uniref:dihydrolipoamide acetyltransferase family protein n=1 Tax=Oligoflexus sp. TaxID=1971216 RepID=UPI002D7EA8C2|nr:dihydrolipoamide acetyltransferase family protein [Oligoflexus sp.]HET9237386.1 dihydrolipoamide acetyltransferase family protein [Oligoflexus sp.]
MAKVTEVLMPLMGEGVHEATLTNWLIKEGEAVTKDSPLLEVSTDKVDTEIPAPASGILVKVLVPVGSVVKVDQALAIISSEAGATVSTELPAAPSSSASATPPIPRDKQPVNTAEADDQHDDSPLRSSPLVRKMAQERGIDLNQVRGSGMHGRITKKDLLDFEQDTPQVLGKPVTVAQAPAPAPLPMATPHTQLKLSSVDGQELLEGVPVRREPMTRMRQLIADHMVESVRVSPHVTTVFEMDLHQIVKLREKHGAEFQKREGFKLTFTPFFIHAAVQAIKKHPIVNTSVDGYDILWKKDINIGCAVALDNGLIVPVIKQAGDLSLAGVARRLNDLVMRARNKKLKPDDVQGGTFSITNPGGWGSITSNPIINQPQVAMLGIGAIVKRPVVIDDMIAIRPMMMVSLTFDHRVIDGEGGSKYLATFKEIIENYREVPI